MKPSRNILVVEVLHDSLYDESCVMCYTYDSWGRIQNITYPDHEVVRYHYDLGGQLCKIDNSAYYTYLDNVTYDRFGAKVSQEYGNGMVTNYSYNNLTRRISIINTMNGNSSFSSQVYTYDPVGNVTQVVSASSWLQNMGLAESFTYDAADQLTSASETLYQSYQLSVNYGNWGKINSYTLNQKDLLQNTTQSEAQAYTYPVSGSLGDCQTLFAPEQRTITDANNNMATETLSFGINGSLRKREVQAQPQTSYTEYYLFNSAANLKAYSNNGLDFAYYGYNASNTRAYKLSMLNQNQWVNGQPEPIHLQLQSAMFYPNAYVNFNHNGEYTKHYYNGSERIASRLGENTVPIATNNNDRLGFRIMQADEQARADLLELVEAGDVPIETPSVEITSLQPTGTSTDIFYYHTNHLGSTAYVTDNNATVTQGFLYAPFGEITTEYNANFGNNVLPKYSFNAKELDEETGMYYYEARYYKPPVFTSRDAMMENKPWLSPYHYCSNNPVGRVDPSGMFDDEAKANKFHHRAVKKYGCERVGDVYNAGTSEEPNYQFRIYDKGKEKDKQWNTLDEKGININAYRGNIISERRDYRNYKHSQGNDILTFQVKFTLGAQAGEKIKKINVSVNIGSVDVASIKYSTGQKIKFDYVDEYGLTTYQMGLSLAFYGCKYTKEPYHDATFIYGPTITKKPIESLIGISREGINVSVGAALIFGIDLDIQYKW